MPPCPSAPQSLHGSLGEGGFDQRGSGPQNQIIPSLLLQLPGQNPLSFTVETPAQCGHTALLRRRMGLHLASRKKRQRRGRNIPPNTQNPSLIRKEVRDGKKKRYHQTNTLHYLFVLYLSFRPSKTSPPPYPFPLLITFSLMPRSLQGVFTNIISCDSFSSPFHFTSLPLPK